MATTEFYDFDNSPYYNSYGFDTASYSYDQQATQYGYSPNHSPSVSLYNESSQSHSHSSDQYMQSHLNSGFPPVNSSALPNLDNSVDECDSPVLRAILSNKSIKRLSPNYNKLPSSKRSKLQTENEMISSIRTEEYLEFFDDFTFEQQQPMKSDFKQAMTSGNLIAPSSLPNSVPTTTLTNPIVSSPITNYIEGISTPPLSPKEEAIASVNQTSTNCDASSAVDNCSWNQNESDGKCFE